MPRPGPPVGVVNADMIREVVKTIEDNFYLWDQNVYLGSLANRNRGQGRVYCLAGWTCRVAGYNVAVLLRRGGENSVFHTARRLLGLTTAQAQQLFYFLEVDGRHPTIAQLKEQITTVTKVRFL